MYVLFSDKKRQKEKKKETNRDKKRRKKKEKYIERFQCASQQIAMAMGAALFWDANLNLFEAMTNITNEKLQ